MSQNNFPTTLPAVAQFVRRVTVAEQSQQKDIRLTIVEGRALISELAMLTSRLSIAIDNINANLERIAASSEHIEVKFDGGGFDKG